MEQQRREEAERPAQMQQLSHQSDDEAAAQICGANRRTGARNDPCPCGSGKSTNSATAV